MRKAPVLFLLSTLAAAVSAYLSNAYQQHQREKSAQEQAAVEQQQQQQINMSRQQDGHIPFSRDNRDRPER